jgi:hypothetical protein
MACAIDEFVEAGTVPCSLTTFPSREVVDEPVPSNGETIFEALLPCISTSISSPSATSPWEELLLGSSVCLRDASVDPFSGSSEAFSYSVAVLMHASTVSSMYRKYRPAKHTVVLGMAQLQHEGMLPSHNSDVGVNPTLQ